MTSSQKKNEFRHLRFLTKKNEFNHWVSFSPKGSGMGTSLGFRGQNFVPSSDIGSVRSDRHGVPTSDAELYFTTWGYNSRLRRASTFLNSDSESTQNLGSICYSVHLSDFCVPSYGSVSDFRGESLLKAVGLCSVSSRKSETDP